MADVAITPGAGRNAPGLGAADRLGLAAAPTFAMMALLTGVFGGQPDVLCAALHGESALSGMIPMYLLMSAFHAGPWLRLMSRKRVGWQPRGSAPSAWAKSADAVAYADANENASLPTLRNGGR